MSRLNEKGCLATDIHLFGNLALLVPVDAHPTSSLVSRLRSLSAEKLRLQEMPDPSCIDDNTVAYEGREDGCKVGEVVETRWLENDIGSKSARRE